MCLGIPGEIIEIYNKSNLKMGRVKFGEVLKEVCLRFTPEAKIGDYVIVHTGFALSILDKREADKIFKALE